MNTKYLQKSPTIKHYPNLAKKSLFFIASFAIAILSTMPASAGIADDLIEGIEDKIDNVQTKVNNIQTNVNDLPGTVQGKLGIALDADLVTNVKESILEVTDVVKELKANIDAFGDGSSGTGCYQFRGSLKSMFMNFGALSEALASIGIPNPPPVDLSANNLIDTIPCKALLSAAFAFENTPLSEVSDRLTEMNEALQVLLPLFIMESQNTILYSRNFNSQPTTELIHTDFCSSVVDERVRIRRAGLGLTGLSVALQIVAAKVDTETFTGGGDINKLRPKAEEVDAGIHGYAHVTIKRADSRHKIAKGIQTLAKILDAVTSAASKIRNNCINTHNQFLLFAQQERLLDLFEGQTKLMNGQEEVIRMLLTPNGKRESDFCHGDYCTSQSWNRTN